MPIECLVLGAGQEVGKSCAIVTINGKRIMFDCGMHMGYSDDRRYPEFSRIRKSNSGDFTDSLDCVIITHFHLDHIGALPYFTQVCGYNGPIYMTYPTKALGPLMLEDYRKVMVDRRGEEEKFSYEDIVNCMKKVTAVDLKQTVHVDKDLQIRAYYAGHVLGAAMFYAKVGDSAMVYTGDYNMSPDRHLGAAQIDRLQLDLVITESTYATTYRDSKYAREREFLQAVHNCVAAGGKVLIPTFALGRAQELCMLLDDYWERMNLKVPIYFSSGLTIQANLYYKILINWTSQKVKDTCSTRNAFDFRNAPKYVTVQIYVYTSTRKNSNVNVAVCSFDRSLIKAPGPCVLFATPGMISGGFSLEVFRQWAPCEGNLIMLPGYCVAGTVGHKLLAAKVPTQINLDQGTRVDVRCQIHQLSFSPHTDAKGIMDLVKFLCPKHVILVHGEKPHMVTLKEKIHSELGIKCYDPANNETVQVSSTQYVRAGCSDAFLESSLCPNFEFLQAHSGNDDSSSGHSSMRAEPFLKVCDKRVAEGILTVQKNQNPRIMHKSEFMDYLELQKHEVKFACCLPLHVKCSESSNASHVLSMPENSSFLHLLLEKLSEQINELTIENCGEHLQIQSFVIEICSKEQCPHRIAGSLHRVPNAVYLCCSWALADEKLAWRVNSVLKDLELRL